MTTTVTRESPRHTPFLVIVDSPVNSFRYAACLDSLLNSSNDNRGNKAGGLRPAGTHR
jgi:hypothetical protein